MRRTISLSTTPNVVLKATQKRKAWTLQNQDDGIQIYIGDSYQDIENGNYAIIYPGGTAYCHLPWGNPRNEIFARSASGTPSLNIEETHEDDHP